jgi:hypothetical protein
MCAGVDPEPLQKGVLVEFHGIAYTVRTGTCLPPRFTSRDDAERGEARVLLRNVSGVARPGQLVAIMGASGAGKTCVLCMRARARACVCVCVCVRHRLCTCAARCSTCWQGGARAVVCAVAC